MYDCVRLCTEFKQRHPSCFEDWSLAILKTTKSANFEICPRKALVLTEQSNSEEKTIVSLNLGSFLITLAQPALVQMMLVFYDKRYIFFSPSTYTVL